MVLVDWIDLSDDDDDEPTVSEGQDAPGPCHAPQIKVETVDLTMEEGADQEDRNAHFVLPKQEFLEAGHGVEEDVQPANQSFPVAGDVVEEAMQSGDQGFVAAVDCAEEAMQSESASGDVPASVTEQGVAADDCAEEAMQSESASGDVPASVTEQGAAADDCAEEAMQSESASGDVPASVTEQGAAADDCAEEAMQSESASGDVPASFTEQGAAADDWADEDMHSESAARDVLSSFTEQGAAAGDCAEEAMQSESAARDVLSSFTEQGAAAGDCAEEAMQSESAVRDVLSSCTQQGVAAGDCAEEVMQSKHADSAATCSPMTEQGSTSCLSMSEQGATTSSSTTQHQNHQVDALLGSPPISTAAHFPRQFWKAGGYKVAAQPSISNGQNCLRINPKFLHSNATSHKWAFGAIAELLDNAVDEVENGATYVKIDKMKYAPAGEYSLVIQDDGGGMSPEDLRHCLSFGFSNKCTNSSIGQYGNGFKTSTMRLGADAIIFSCRQDKRLTRSVGLLSYTFLARTGCNDILVPVVDYEFDPSSCTPKRIMDRGEKHFSSNLSTLLRWSPFSSEEDLLNQFRDMGCHGTKIVVFNLWFNDAWEMELDFTTDDEDIMISGAPKIPDERRKVERLNHMHIANRFRYSLRVYASILYLRLPEHFKVILCGRVVEPHHIVNDLIYCECVQYRPRVGVTDQADVSTIIGFLKGAPKLDIYGFNIYHRNRLILPFWSAASERGRGRGIVGVLEANFIRPTHDKQDFEKTELFQRLDTRLKDMTTEYWRYHAYLIGTRQVTKARPPAYYASISATKDDSSATRATTVTYAGNSGIKTSVVLDRCFNEEPFKRRNSGSKIEMRAQKRQNTNANASYPGGVGAVEIGEERSSALIYQNKTLKAECSQLEAAGQQLRSKAEKLSNELREYQRLLMSLAKELQFHDGLSALQRTTIPTARSSYMGAGWI